MNRGHLHVVEKRLDSQSSELDIPDLREIEPAYYCRRASAAQLFGEAKMLLKMVEDAIDTIKKYASSDDDKAQEAVSDALAWIRSNDRSYSLSFLNICETLEMNDVEGLREMIRRHVRIAFATE